MALGFWWGKSLILECNSHFYSELVIQPFFRSYQTPKGGEISQFPRVGVDILVSININYNLVLSKFPIYIHYSPRCLKMCSLPLYDKKMPISTLHRVITAQNGIFSLLRHSTHNRDLLSPGAHFFGAHLSPPKIF